MADGKVTLLKPLEELANAYNSLVPNKQATVIIHCRTGHQASQTFFVMRYLLGYERVLWYDAGWSEWAARSELPVEKKQVAEKRPSTALPSPLVVAMYWTVRLTPRD